MIAAYKAFTQPYRAARRFAAEAAKRPAIQRGGEHRALEKSRVEGRVERLRLSLGASGGGAGGSGKGGGGGRGGGGFGGGAAWCSLGKKG
jgi:hypothetical protein